MDMAKNYNPAEFEQDIYADWQDKGYFRAHADKSKKPFTILMPPPNITGQLHLGHALNNGLQDAVIRFRRMQGYSALWLPGTDHASIATEVKIVEEMQTEGLTKQGIGREKFLQRAFKWKDKYGGRIVEQLKVLGCSCDWSRLSFTMDERCSKAVLHVFVDLYRKGLIYRGNRIINWCPCCRTALSDAEVEFSEHQGSFWHIRYPAEDGGEGVVVATTRPETMLGDTAVAVNPGDKRYSALIGKKLVLPLTGRVIPVVADDYVDAEFGTGAVKITPAHDPNDFEVGQRHNLEVVRVMDDGGIINKRGGSYAGLDRYEARKKIVEDLKAQGLLVKVKPHTHNVGHCYRCDSVVEPIVSRQWFVKMDTLAAPAVEAVKNKEIKFLPRRFEKIYFNWMENIRDWCISRQLWWGHRIPAYTCGDCQNLMVETTAPKVCSKCGGSNITQDEDVLDTWFSSALWPFSTLGYPEETADLGYFYPTSVLITAYDIIFFWVARMIFSGLEYMKQIPFEDVLFTGLVLDSQGRKMSKSLGNGIDPMEIIEKYGADTLRLSLLSGVAPGGDMRFSEEKLEGCRNFVNKLWNASRFVLMNAEEKKIPALDDCRLSSGDKWILHRYNALVRSVTSNMEKYELGLASAKLYDFVWSDFCDWYIEMCKPYLYGDDEAARLSALGVLTHVLMGTLKMLHPFIPFVTERIFQSLPGASGSIMVSDYPLPDKKLVFSAAASDMEAVKDLIRAIRNLRADMQVAPSRRATLYVLASDARIQRVLRRSVLYLEKLASASAVQFITQRSKAPQKSVTVTQPGVEVFLELGELVDTEKEKARLSAELDRALSEAVRAQAKLNNPGFTQKAPAELVEKEKQKHAQFSKLADELRQKLEAL